MNLKNIKSNESFDHDKKSNVDQSTRPVTAQTRPTSS